MAKDLTEAWKTLLRQLMLRGYLLRETLNFYRLANQHEELSAHVAREMVGGNTEKIGQLINQVIDVTAAAVDAGSSVIAQIRTLGQIDDNVERGHQVLNACVDIERIILKIAGEWEKIEGRWVQEKEAVPKAVTTIEEELTVIEQWLVHAEKRIKAVNENGQKALLREGSKHQTRLQELSIGCPSEKRQAVTHLYGRIEEFIHYLKTRMNRSQRIQGFFQSSQAMLSQLSMMESDLRNKFSLAGELVPLARQKTNGLIAEGKDIQATEVLSHEEQRYVRLRCEELHERLKKFEEAVQQIEREQQQNGQLQQQHVQQQQAMPLSSHPGGSLFEWMDMTAVPFLAQNGDMGGNLAEAHQFVAAHKEFANQIMNRESSIMSQLGQMQDREKVIQFEKSYRRLKETVDNRTQLGENYEAVHRFAKDLEASFDALTALLDTNRDFTNEKVAAQMNNVFQMIRETLGQEKQQGEKFISHAEQIGKSDEWLNVVRAQTAVSNLIIDHGNRFTYINHKWNEWQKNKTERSVFEKRIEEIQMWQDDVIEIIGKLGGTETKSHKENEEIRLKIHGFAEAGDRHSATLAQMKGETANTEILSRIEQIEQRQQEIRRKLHSISQGIETSSLRRVIEEIQMWQTDAIEIIKTLDAAEVKTGRDCEQMQQRVDSLRKEMQERSTQISDLARTTTSEQQLSQISKVAEAQQYISQAVNNLTQKFSVSQVLRTIEEIQMWQTEQIEILKIIASSQPKDRREVDESIEKIEKVQEEEQQKSSQIREVLQQAHQPIVQKASTRLVERQNLIREEAQKIKQVMEQKKLTRTVEEIQMWQENTIEIIRLLGARKIDTVQDNEILKTELQKVKRDVEDVSKRVSEISEQEDIVKKSKVKEIQRHIQDMVGNLERRVDERQTQLTVQSQPQAQAQPETVQESKTVDLTYFETSEYAEAAKKTEVEKAMKTIELVQIWQEETVEIIRTIKDKPVTTKEDLQHVEEQVQRIHQNVVAQDQRIQEAKKTVVEDETYRIVLEDTSRRQQIISQLVKELDEKVEQDRKRIQTQKQPQPQQQATAPKIIIPLRDAEIDEGSRFEFAARIDSQPEAVITWLKDGIDVKSNMDYRQQYINGVASLVIEESFIEDTATYTVRATNSVGQAESSAKLIVKSRSAMSSTILEDEKPRFVKQLQNIQVNEGETAHLDCVIVGKPEPEVVWQKSEDVVQEDERTHLTFAGDHCRLTIERVTQADSGTYLARARNVHGEVANFCQLKVQPKRAPPTFPKPVMPSFHRPQRAPTIQPTLTNSTWQEGSKATLQVYVQGEPRPVVQWNFNNQPITTTEEVKIEETADGWTRLTIPSMQPRHAGLYTVKAVNEVGEAVTGATLHIAGQYQPEPLSHVSRELSTISEEKRSEEKRWVDMIESEYRAASSVGSPIPNITSSQTTETRRTEQRWVDSIDEIMAQPSVTREDREVRTAETYAKMVDELMRDVPVQPRTDTRQSREIEDTESLHTSSHRVHEPSPRAQPVQTSTSTTQLQYISQSHEPIQPAVGQATRTDESARTMNIATIRQSPQPELHSTHITAGLPQEHAAKVGQTPHPEMGQPTITSGSPAVENVAKIQQPIEQPAPQTAMSQKGLPTGQIAQVHMPSGPADRRSIERSQPPIERIDDIIILPEEKKSGFVQTTTITTEGGVHKDGQSIPLIKETITTTRRGADEEVIRSGEERSMSAATVREIVPEVKEQKTSQTVTETTTGEGWVHTMQQEPHGTTVTIKRLDIEESGINRAGSQASAVPTETVVTTRRIETEDSGINRGMSQGSAPSETSITIKKLNLDESEELARQLKQQTASPQTTRKTMTTTIVEGGVHTADNQAEHIRYFEPTVTQTVTQTRETDEETASVKQRDSMLVASDVEGYWTDGYTPTPPPLPAHRLPLGESPIMSEPEFIRAFQREYTAEEGESFSIECVLVGNPRPKIRLFFNENQIRLNEKNEFAQISQINDTIRVSIKNATLEHAGYYKLIAENKRGVTETLTVVHVRPRGLSREVKQGTPKRPTEKTTITEEFAMFEYEQQRRPQKHEGGSRLITPPPAKRAIQTHRNDQELLEQYELEERRRQAAAAAAASLQATSGATSATSAGSSTVSGHPPHFTQTLVSAVAADGDSARFEAVVTGWPAPTVEWTKDGVALTRNTLPDIQISNIGGRVALVFDKCQPIHGGKYMCTARNTSGVATSSAQLVVRPKTTAPDFIQRLISEEIEEGAQLKWTVRVTGDPEPTVG
ncbi:hypothetical protein WR25_25180 isoform C [Diploscapter pachys]|uniref:Ig-like domain-containing protein n=1 Tax=Diploscapter pachys TaxID=2018661 RepID=A0A2A2JAI5_9BILA|nr:hypothetical protein WR25_25180 isoform C [Diploscapter pachys]